MASGLALPVPTRVRVQSRQAWVYSVAAQMGWDGPAAEAIREGVQSVRNGYRAADGTFAGLPELAGAEELNTRFDLYDQAFVLLGLSAAHAPPVNDSTAQVEALALLDFLDRNLTHPLGGFEEGAPPRLPLRANPHMHLFEAAIAWRDAGGDACWGRMANSIGQLALTRFIDPRTSALREFYDAVWHPAAGLEGRFVEPGHMFEWAWLLLCWAPDRSEVVKAALRLIEASERFGVDPAQGVAVNVLLDDFSSHDPVARLWPQTERIKAGLRAAAITGDDRWLTGAIAGAHALWRYLDVPIQGLWRDRLQPDGTFIDEPAPASSFYHIAAAIREMAPYT